jgi:hypothetical protein
MSVNLVSGELGQTQFWYQTQDCTGTPFIKIDNGGLRGGFLAYTRAGDHPIVGIVEWGSEVNPNSLRSSWQENGQCADYFSQIDAIPITIIDPADFGVTELPGEVAPGIKGLGFLPPIIPREEKSEGIFCSGFESCPNE